MAQKGKAKNKLREREQSKNRDREDDISRITRSFRRKEHMSYGGQSHAGEEEQVRHLRAPFRERVLGGANV